MSDSAVGDVTGLPMIGTPIIVTANIVDITNTFVFIMFSTFIGKFSYGEENKLRDEIHLIYLGACTAMDRLQFSTSCCDRMNIIVLVLLSSNVRKNKSVRATRAFLTSLVENVFLVLREHARPSFR